MYVCLCRGITDSALRQSALDRPGVDARRICRDLGAGTDCGRCARTALAVVHAAQARGADTFRAVPAAAQVVRMLPQAV